MRQTFIVAATIAVVTAIVAIWGATVIIAHSPKQTNAGPVSKSIDVMQIMKDAKNLPEERFDAN
jgi:hypothetical protein